MTDIHVDADFHRYLKGGCHSGGGEAPKNVIKNDDFYRAVISLFFKKKRAYGCRAAFYPLSCGRYNPFLLEPGLRHSGDTIYGF
jgi:hypothetical protein